MKPLSWAGVLRLSLVQMALGALAALTTSTLNRVMIVEAAAPAALPAAFVAWHYATQLLRPRFGHGGDGRRRAPLIIGGVGILALGSLLATDAALMLKSAFVPALLLALVGYTAVGAGVGAAGTSLLALLAQRVAPERRPAAAAAAWMAMVLGIVLAAVFLSLALEPFSAERLATSASMLAGAAFLVTVGAVLGFPEGAGEAAGPRPAKPPFRVALAAALEDPLARRFTLFVFLSMLGYAAEELALEPFAGLVFRLDPAGSAQISATLHLGALLGMAGAGALAGRLGRGARPWLRGGLLAGCVGSALSLALLAGVGLAASAAALRPVVFALGLANGVFTVSAIGSMMGLAGEGGPGREGVRMGIWGAAQAAGFALGGFVGAVGLDVLRAVFAAGGPAFAGVFIAQAGLFLAAAVTAARLEGAPAPQAGLTLQGAQG